MTIIENPFETNVKKVRLLREIRLRSFRSKAEGGGTRPGRGESPRIGVNPAPDRASTGDRPAAGNWRLI